MHYDRTKPYGKASTANSTGRLELYCVSAVSNVSAHFTSEKALSQFDDEFHGLFPRRSYKGWARADNLGMKLVSAANIPKKDRNSVTLRGAGASLMALTFSPAG